jgi:hypothetical protein
MTTATMEAPSLFALIPTWATWADQSALGTINRPLQTVEQVTGSETTVEVEVRADLTDDQLISAICEEKEWAMELLYERHSRYAYALAYRILHDTSAAEDIVQEAFLSVCQVY